MSEGSRLLVSDPSLRGVADGFAESVWTLTDVELPRMTAEGDGAEGDIRLRVDSSFEPEGYSLSTSDVITVTGGSATGVAWGLSALLQLATVADRGLSVPRVVVEDGPASPFRGLAVDVASRPYSVEELKELVVLCHVYRVRFLQLRLTAAAAFTLPVEALPGVTSWRGYDERELADLQRFASNRGVTIVPELGLPGGARALIEGSTEPLGLQASGRSAGTLHMGRESVYQTVETIVDEVAQLFGGSPYIHLGGRRPDLAGFEHDAEAAAFMEVHDLDGTEDLFRYFLARTAEMVRSRGKRPVAWDGFRASTVAIPTDLLVVASETSAIRPDSLLGQGYEVVNGSVAPLQVAWGRRWDTLSLVRWNPYRWEHWSRNAPSFEAIRVPVTPRVRGGLMGVWEQDAFLAVPTLRRRLPPVAEELWVGKDRRHDFAARVARADDLLRRLTRPARVDVVGLLDPAYDGPDVNRQDRFAESVSLQVGGLVPGDRVVVTRDGAPPSAEGPFLEDTLRIDGSGPLRFLVVDRSGRARGFPWMRYLERWPIEARTSGALPRPDGDPAWVPDAFVDSMTVALDNLGSRGRIHYTVDGTEPGASSPPYEGPLRLSATTRVRARVWGENAAPMGAGFDRTYRRIPAIHHGARDRPVRTAPGDPAAHAARLVVDGLIDNERYWTAPVRDGPWLELDLGSLQSIDRFRVFTHWDGVQAFQYVLTGSVDRREWHPLVDRSSNAAVAEASGYEDVVPVSGRAARWIRFQFVGASLLDRGALVELAVLQREVASGH